MSNTAQSNGGAIYAYESEIELNHDLLNITNNTAKDNGGAFYLSKTTLILDSNNFLLHLLSILLEKKGEQFSYLIKILKIYRVLIITTV